MKNKLQILHPATMFFLLTVIVVLLSWVADIYGLHVMHPQTRQEVEVQSLLSPEGIRWWLRNVFGNFTGFKPLGLVLVAMFGLGVAEHSGFIHACIRSTIGRYRNRTLIMLIVILLGILSNVIGDVGYIILLPISATLFQSVGLHPIAGIITSYVSVACAYSANLTIGTMDPILAASTQRAAFDGGIDISVGPLSNYYFMAVSTFLLGGIIYLITRHQLVVKLGKYSSQSTVSEFKSLSRKERRALGIALMAALCYAVLLIIATSTSYGFLRGVDGTLLRSPFIQSALFLITFGFGLSGMIYGFTSGRYRTDSDVIAGFTQPMHLLGIYFVIAFFAAQMFACLEYSRLDLYITIWGANLLESVQLSTTSLLTLFILYIAFLNLFMVSATGKWAFMSFIFVPMFAQMGIAPEVTQCAYRVGDSATNGLTPFLFYMPLVLTYMQQYDRNSTYLSLLSYTWRYSLAILVIWTAFFLAWIGLGIPVGI